MVQGVPIKVIYDTLTTHLYDVMFNLDEYCEHYLTTDTVRNVVSSVKDFSEEDRDKIISCMDILTRRGLHKSEKCIFYWTAMQIVNNTLRPKLDN